MCGLCGIAVFDSAAERVPRAPVAAMLAAMAHRGPDGAWLAGDIGAVFGLARLAIRGLSDGVQPMVDQDTGVMVVCNGEIDNHHELRAWLSKRGRPVLAATDVAVLPGLYLELGATFVERLVGAFALAVWDPRRMTVLFARDRAGERPLFFHRDDRQVWFASEIAALTISLRNPPQPDRPALTRYLQLGYFGAPDTPFSGIEKLGPGETVVLDAQGTRRERYWRWGEGPRTAKVEPSDAFDDLFREAIRRQSDADVPRGLFLSGGLDSSLVAAVARRVRPDLPLTAYGLRFDEPSYDEGAYAEQVAALLGIEYVPVWVRPEDLPPLLTDLVRRSGEPLADPAWAPTALLARRAAEDVRVVLVGEGADELFGGYPTYFGAGIAEWYSRLPRPLRALLRVAVEHWPPSEKKVTPSFLLKRFVQGDGLDALSRHMIWNASIPSVRVESLGLRPERIPSPTLRSGAMLDRLQHYDLERSLAEGLLSKADRAGMRSGLELRAPFLDAAVMDFAAGLPVRQRVRGVATKVFLKRYAERYLPRDIVYRTKRGLSVPLTRWLRGPLSDWAHERLSDPHLGRFGLDQKVVLGLFHAHQHHQADHARTLWTLLALTEWLEWAEQAGKRGGHEESRASRVASAGR